MTIRTRSVLIVVAALALAGLAFAWWTGTHRRIWLERTLPVEGEASYNDYFVIQQALRAMGVRVQSTPHLPEHLAQWRSDDALVLGSDTRTLSPNQQHALLDWVGRGGRLLLAADSDQASGANGFLAAIGVASGQRLQCVHWNDAGRTASEHCFATIAILPSERENFVETIGDDDTGWLLARRNWGLGSIEVVGDLQLLKNQAIDEPQHVDWAWQLLAPLAGNGTLRIVYQTELPPLYVYLVRYGWFALLPLLLALIGWLWARAQRFGPALVLPDADRRALGEHIMASGEFLYRRGLVAALHAPLLRRFDEQLRRRDPALSALPFEDRVRALAQRGKLPVEAVRNALATPPPRQHKAFVQAVQTLLRMTSSK